MNEFIELIDFTSGNVVGDFADVEEAMATLCEVAARHGRKAIANLSLMRIDGEEQSLVAMQEELANMVEDHRLAEIVAASSSRDLFRPLPSGCRKAEAIGDRL